MAIALIWLCMGAVFYPKWNKAYTEATISWDVSGYYHYLPAIFIYKDIRHQEWMHAINAQYLPSTAYDQAFGHHDSGHKVNKYAIGQAVLYTPFFLIAHAYASLSTHYPADGYSRPYQVALWLGSLLFSILGLILLRKLLLIYFEDRVVLLTLLALALGTHWLEYAAITNAMNHGWLFTLMCVLVLSSIRFYKQQDLVSVLGIGCSLGLASLTRPTEIIWLFVPLLWGMTNLKARINFLGKHWKKVFLAICLTLSIGFIQLIYWKYASGEWIVYSYGDQGFQWLNPRIREGLVGVRIGWWTYTPLMLIAMFGWYGLYKKYPSVFWPCFIVFILALYITLSWSHFDGGGGLGQRNLIQIYPLMAFPLAVVVGWFVENKMRFWILICLLIANVYYNAWWIHQAHKGGFFKAGQTTTPYFMRVVGRLNPDRDLFKLLDTDEYFHGEPAELVTVLKNDFEADTTIHTIQWPGGSTAVFLHAENQMYGPLDIPIANHSAHDWLRIEADFMITSREWTFWKYSQWIVRFFNGEEVIKSSAIRLQRLIPVDHQLTSIYFDVKIPEENFDRCTLTLWNSESPGQILMDDLVISTFSGN